LLIGGFTPEPKVAGRLLFDGIWRWVKMEFAALWWSKGAGKVVAETAPVKLPASGVFPVQEETKVG
jgi:hypothetical protein